MKEEGHVIVHVEMDEESIQKHLLEAEKNKLANAHIKDVTEADEKFRLQLQAKLQETQSNIQQHDKCKSIDLVFNSSIEHEDFEKKRKEHYKNEYNPALLLKGGLLLDEEEDSWVSEWVCVCL